MKSDSAFRLGNLLVLVLLLAAYAVVLAEPIRLTTADLGRHLKNGQLFVETGVIPKTNLYSYTFPDQPFVNHHWGSGVVFFLIHRLAGFQGLSLFFILLSLVSFLLFFHLAWRFSRFDVAAVASAVVIPLLATRIEIRPEVFSYFFSALFFWILVRERENAFSWRTLFLLPVLEIFWVNLHIYFFMGLVLIGVFILEDLVSKRTAHLKRLLVIGALTALACLVNPFGIAGAVYPLMISHHYGYLIVENRPVWLIEKIVRYPPGFYFKVVFGWLTAGWIFAAVQTVKGKGRISIAAAILSLMLGAAAWLAPRNFALFGYFALPLSAMLLKDLFPENSERGVSRAVRSFLLVVAILAGALAIQIFYWRAPYGPRGIGLKEGVDGSAEFFLKEGIAGPILNNYDIGGYLIYSLYPMHRVFVDNRPEAYPASFFQDTYVPLQEKEERWQEEQKRYGFNCIFFQRNDFTPWAQDFLVRRIQDPAWAPVYVDDDTILLLRRGGPNESTIRQYELPKSMFQVTRLK